MVILDDFKLLYLSKPKCFSTSVRHALKRYGDVYWTPKDGLHPHTNASEAKALFEDTARDWDEYTKITTARDPVGLISSYFNWGRCDNKNRYYWMKGWDESDPMDFEAWFWEGKLFNRKTKTWKTSKKQMSVLHFAGIDDVIAVDEIYHDGSLAALEDRLSDLIGKEIKISHRNKGPERKVDRKPLTFTREILDQIHLDFWFEYKVLNMPFEP